MPKYRYTAVNGAGKTVRGELAAADEQELFEKLKAEGCCLIAAKEAAVKRHTGKLKTAVLADCCRELGTLLDAGVPLARALDLLCENDSLKQKDRGVWREVLRLIRQGQTLSDAMEAAGGVFPAVMIQAFRASGEAGNMGEAALRMAEYYRKEHRLQEQVKSAMAYPKLLGVVMLAVLVILMRYVLPQFEPLFSMLEELPLPTRILYGVTGFFEAYWYVAVILAAAGMVLWSVAGRMEPVQQAFGSMKVHLPLAGTTWKRICTARFARTLSTLYAAGIPMLAAMEAAKDSVGNLYIERQLETALLIVRSGGSLSEALRNVDGLVRKLEFAVRVGEETGRLDGMLNAISDDLEYDSGQAVSRMILYLEPVMIVILAVIVGFIMIAVMLPIYESYMAMDMYL
ncbi:MAG: type II secretion system F family protein [Eubacteriales bacterium]|nr:type II secretion system F family protein [Eubacteriales bacterium]